MSTGNYPSAGQPEPGRETPSADRTPGSYGNAPSYSSDAAGVPAGGPAAEQSGGAAERRVTRTGVIWAAVVAALVLLILLIIFILQNQELVLVKFLGFEGAVPLGMALFIASVTGGVLVAAAGGARILQLRASAHRARARQRR
ncbi:lipopolysaccharide assembly protein LapA domain-containing protein [Pseudarthrobacter sp. NamE5]|uniref:lipopolysaccharide assembly protein LapA domain-containing protein n=1 Tax=Pseudarthrobacter sp. NamE5 TaxID=2576839 RepID=UPI00110BA273|nr:LapA family protein [Pseudarthrobacter sp. NamE5]TLM88115.1 LapA family protein [Pseudarthrobacter sp. NamE5]